jgi:aldoxime dehydratase
LRHRRISADHVPPYPAVVARFDPDVTHVVIGFFGFQYKGRPPAAAAESFAQLVSLMSAPDGPSHHEYARGLDDAGFVNMAITGYWRDRGTFETWLDAHGLEWTRGPLPAGIGRFTEVAMPPVNRIESIAEPGSRQGLAELSGALSGAVEEAGYWGAARDRLPFSQLDGMSAAGQRRVIVEDDVTRVIGHDNACLIVSGQDFSAMRGLARDDYLRRVEPCLASAMAFLDREGATIGCHANRYMSLLGPRGPTDKTFGMSWWRDLAALERWAESHYTHLAIYGAAMRLHGNFGGASGFRRWHEIFVASSAEQFHEYRRCHSRTGLLRDA